MEHEYAISGMHCQSCVSKIKAALESVSEVRSADVTFSPPRALVSMDSHVPTARLAEAVSAVGKYELKAAKNSENVTVATKPDSLYPLFLIIGYISGVVIVIAAASSTSSLNSLMRHFMAGFFLVFSFFKFLDLKGFSDAYRTYDVIAKKLPGWGNMYPFVELGLGIAYLVNVSPHLVNFLTLVVMLSASVGVIGALLRRSTIQCACLGTVLKLPMTKITLVEDLGMATMAAAMLIL